jgi:hypothetical protein
LVKYSAVRAGLSWPQGLAPAYYCILGEEFLGIDEEGRREQKGKLKLFAEYEFPGISLNDFFAKLTDDCHLFCCDSIYTDYTFIGDKFGDFAEAFYDYTRNNNIKRGSIQPAPFVDNFLLGVSTIQDWIGTKRLELPEDTIVHQQLKRITKPDLEESPEVTFYAINGLRFVVGAFDKDRPYIPSQHRSLPISHEPGAWMAR